MTKQILQSVVPWRRYGPGGMVYLQEKTMKKQVSPKLMPKWKGPNIVFKCLRTVYEIMTHFKGHQVIPL